MPQKKAATRGSSRSKRGTHSNRGVTHRGTRSTTRKRSTGNDARSRREVETLQDGFVAELQDMLHGETQILHMLQKVTPKVRSPQLRDGLEMHTEQTEEHIDRLHRVFELLNQPARPEKCEGLQGILEEGDELLGKTGPGPVRDAMLIASAQKVEHYEIASYGTLCAWADELGMDQAVQLLAQTLREEKAMDKQLSRVAESAANRQAEFRDGRDTWAPQRNRGGSWSHPSRGDMDRGAGDGRNRGFDGGRMVMESRTMEQGRERAGRYRERDED